MQLGPCSKTYSCVLVVGHATSAPPRTTKMEVKLQPSYNTCSCGHSRRHVVASLAVWLATGTLSLDTASSNKTKGQSRVACLVASVQPFLSPDKETQS